jgi:hypothetical protein
MPGRPFSQRRFASWTTAKASIGNLDSVWAFRGVADASWHLQTSLERAWPGPERSVAEQLIINQYVWKRAGFRQAFPQPTETLGTLAEMQHFAAPTRLMDWTKSMLVAAFFAFQNPTSARWCAIWAIDLTWCKAKAIAAVRAVGGKYAGLTIRDDLSNAELLRDVVMTNTVRVGLPIVSYEMNERLSIQQGLFMCPGNINISFEDNIAAYDSDETRQKWLKFLIPAKCRKDVLQDLRSMNISAATLFPGLDGFGRNLHNELFLLRENPAIFNKCKGDVRAALIYT